MVKFDDIESAFYFVSGGSYGENKAYLDQESGKLYFGSAYGDFDELPDDVDSEKYVAIPHKNDLNLEKSLVLDFAFDYLPDDVEEIQVIFGRRGAYGRFKDLLDERDLLERWYDYEEKAKNRALRQWCEENAIQLDTE